MTGNLEEFERKLGILMEQVVSHHDTAQHPEAFYHSLMLGLTASLSQNKAYELQSNRESGKGRYDYLILAKDPQKLSILLEFKKAAKSKTEKELEAHLNEAADDALAQIEQKNYAAIAQQRGCTQLLKIGLAFSEKSFLIKQST